MRASDRFRWNGRMVLVMTALLAAGCGGEPEPYGPGTTLTDIITNVSARGGAANGVFHAGTAPTGSADLTASVSGISSVVNGGSASVGLAGSGEFQRLYVSVLGADGYYDVVLPSGTTAEDLVMSLAPGLGGGNLRLNYVLEGPAGPGPVAEQSMRVIRVGTGDVQVSVAWTGASDVDLSVVDPSGEVVYYGNLQAASGGRLDLDSNPACVIDNKNNENIVWPVNGAPAGQYQVRLSYYDDCGVASSEWVVTLQVKDQPPRTFTGSFVGDQSVNPDELVTTFTY